MKILDVFGNTEAESESSGKWKGQMKASLAAPLERTWQIASDFSGLHKFVPIVEICERVKGCNLVPGCIRFYTMDSSTGLPGGKRKAWARDRLVKIEEETHSYTYAVEGSNMNLENCEISFKATDGKDGSTEVTWSWEMDPVKKSTREKTLDDMSEFGCAFIKGVEAAAAVGSTTGATNFDFEGPSSFDALHCSCKADKDNFNKDEKHHSEGNDAEDDEDLSVGFDECYSEPPSAPSKMSSHLDTLTRSLSEISQKLDLPVSSHAYQHELECLQSALAEGRRVLVSHMDRYVNDLRTDDKQSSSSAPRNNSRDSNVENSSGSPATRCQIRETSRSNEANHSKPSRQRRCKPSGKRPCCSGIEGPQVDGARPPREAKAEGNRMMMTSEKEQDQQRADTDLASQGVYHAFQNFSNQFQIDLRDDLKKQLAFVEAQLERLGFQMQAVVRAGVKDGTFKVLPSPDGSDKNKSRFPQICGSDGPTALTSTNSDSEDRLESSRAPLPVASDGARMASCSSCSNDHTTIPPAGRSHETDRAALPLQSSLSQKAKTVCSAPYEPETVPRRPFDCKCLRLASSRSSDGANHPCALPLETPKQGGEAVNSSSPDTSKPIRFPSPAASSVHPLDEISEMQAISPAPPPPPQCYVGSCECPPPPPAEYSGMPGTHIRRAPAPPVVERTESRTSPLQQPKNNWTSEELHNATGFSEPHNFRLSRLQGSLQSIDSIRFRSSQIYRDLVQEEMSQDFQRPSKAVTTVIRRTPSATRLLQVRKGTGEGCEPTTSCSKSDDNCRTFWQGEEGPLLQAESSLNGGFSRFCTRDVLQVNNERNRASTMTNDALSKDWLPTETNTAPKGWTQRASQIPRVARGPDLHNEVQLILRENPPPDDASQKHAVNVHVESEVPIVLEQDPNTSGSKAGPHAIQTDGSDDIQLLVPETESLEDKIILKSKCEAKQATQDFIASRKQAGLQHSSECQESGQFETSPPPAALMMEQISDRNDVGEPCRLEIRSGTGCMKGGQAKPASHDFTGCQKKQQDSTGVVPPGPSGTLEGSLSQAIGDDSWYFDTESEQWMPSAFRGIPCSTVQGGISCSENSCAMLELGREIAPGVFHCRKGNQTRVVVNISGEGGDIESRENRELNSRVTSSLARKEEIYREFALLGIQKPPTEAKILHDFAVARFKKKQQEFLLQSREKENFKLPKLELPHYAHGKVWNLPHLATSNLVESSTLVSSRKDQGRDRDRDDVAQDAQVLCREATFLGRPRTGLLMKNLTSASHSCQTVQNTPQSEFSDHRLHLRGRVVEIESECSDRAAISNDVVQKQDRRELVPAHPCKCRTFCAAQNHASAASRKVQHNEEQETESPLAVAEDCNCARMSDKILPTANLNVGLLQLNYQSKFAAEDWTKTQSRHTSSNNQISQTEQHECLVHAAAAAKAKHLVRAGEAWHNDPESSLTKVCHYTQTKDPFVISREKSQLSASMKGRGKDMTSQTETALPLRKRVAARDMNGGTITKSCVLTEHQGGKGIEPMTKLSSAQCANINEAQLDESFPNTIGLGFERRSRAETARWMNAHQPDTFEMSSKGILDRIFEIPARPERLQDNFVFQGGNTNECQEKSDHRAQIPFRTAQDSLLLLSLRRATRGKKADPVPESHAEILDWTSIAPNDDASGSELNNRSVSLPSASETQSAPHVKSKFNCRPASFPSPRAVQNAPQLRKTNAFIPLGENTSQAREPVDGKTHRHRQGSVAEAQKFLASPSTEVQPESLLPNDPYPKRHVTQYPTEVVAPAPGQQYEEQSAGSQGSEGSRTLKNSSWSSLEDFGRNRHNTQMLDAMIGVSEFMNDLRSYSQMLDDMAQKQQQQVGSHAVSSRAPAVPNSEYRKPHLAVAAAQGQDSKEKSDSSRHSPRAKKSGKQIQDDKGREEKNDDVLLDYDVGKKKINVIKASRGQQNEGEIVSKDHPTQSQKNYDYDAQQKEEPRFREDSGANFLNSISAQIYKEFSTDPVEVVDTVELHRQQQLIQGQSFDDGASQGIESGSETTDATFLQKISRQILREFSDNIDDYSFQPKAFSEAGDAPSQSSGMQQHQQPNHLEPRFREDSALNFLTLLSGQVHELHNRRTSEATTSGESGRSDPQPKFRENSAVNFLNALKAEIMSQGKVGHNSFSGLEDSIDFGTETDQSSTLSEPISRVASARRESLKPLKVNHQKLGPFDPQAPKSVKHHHKIPTAEEQGSNSGAGVAAVASASASSAPSRRKSRSSRSRTTPIEELNEMLHDLEATVSKSCRDM